MSYGPFQIVECQGTPYEIGLAHGQQAAEKIKVILQQAWNITFRQDNLTEYLSAIGADITDFPKENFPAAVLKNNSIKNLAERKSRQTVQYSA